MLKKFFKYSLPMALILAVSAISAFAAEPDVEALMQTGVTKVQGDLMGVLGIVVPVLIGITGVIVAVRFGLKWIKKVGS